MAANHEARGARRIKLATAIPRQCRPSDRASILADDRLIEDIRCGRITEDDAGEPLVRMLAWWRRQVLAGV
jgi:hypothetical protein